MSEEQNHNHECHCKQTSLGLIWLIVISLLFSIASLTMSIVAYNSVPHKKIVVISKKYDKGQNLDKAIETKKPMIVFFYVDWCGYCQRFAPTFHKITKNKEIKSNFAIAYVNCDDTKNADLLKEYKVGGFPTVYIVDENGKRTHIDNALMFQEDAVKTLTEDFLELIDKD